MDGLMDFANDYDIKAMAILIMSCHDMIDLRIDQPHLAWLVDKGDDHNCFNRRELLDHLNIYLKSLFLSTIN